MKFQTTQFIEVEDRIFGPLTLKQFIYLVGTGGALYLIYTYIPFFFAVLLGLPIGGLGVALAFYKVNNKPFVNVVENAFRFYIGSKLYLWKKEVSKESVVAREAGKNINIVGIPPLSASKLKDLAWSLDIQERGQQGNEPTPSREKKVEREDKLNISV